MATTAPDPALISAVTNTAAQVQQSFDAILPIALPVAGAILAAFIGWRIFRRMVKA